MSSAVLLDTDILSYLLRNQPKVTQRAKLYLENYRYLTFSLITRYEILRGLQVKPATTQLMAFNQLCAVSHILPLTEQAVVQAADIYADLYRRGLLIGEADILIAATARVNGLTLVTNNIKHFKRINQLQLDNWLE